jgi:hypothetical protein
MDSSHPQCRHDMRFSGACSADQNQIVRGFHEGRGCQLLNLSLEQRRFGPIDSSQIAMHREARRLELVTQAAHLAISQSLEESAKALALGDSSATGGARQGESPERENGR